MLSFEKLIRDDQTTIRPNLNDEGDHEQSYLLTNNGFKSKKIL